VKNNDKVKYLISKIFKVCEDGTLIGVQVKQEDG
jgi:hypothetical protein